MKKQKVSSKKRHKIHAQKKAKRERTHNTRSYENNPEKKQQQTKRIAFPERLDLMKNTRETLAFFDKLRKVICVQKNKVFLDLKKCRYVSIESCAVLAAEIQSCQRFGGRDVINGNFPNDTKLYSLLNELGFFKILEITHSPPFYGINADFAVFPIVNGADNPEIIGKIQSFIEKNTDITTKHPQFSSSVFRALSESMLNVREHAYPNGFKNNYRSTEKRWWCSVVFEKSQKKLLFVMYDQGIGIPEHFMRKHTSIAKGLVKKFKLTNDCDKIDAAMNLGESGVLEKGKGKGSGDMKNLIKISKEGTLYVLSKGGKCVYSSNGKLSEKQSLPYPIEGTLIIWLISLDQYRETNKI
ncbi:MAG: hypothetical protein ABW189_07735 [Rickettsiales bacterium]